MQAVYFTVFLKNIGPCRFTGFFGFSFIFPVFLQLFYKTEFISKSVISKKKTIGLPENENYDYLKII